SSSSIFSLDAVDLASNPVCLEIHLSQPEMPHDQKLSQAIKKFSDYWEMWASCESGDEAAE
ncbi:unnamed protein product, partial [Eruca vesicaria subsp. sativa]|nr:unnamed protein product [Eruca vesicaria subsp. sativa]